MYLSARIIEEALVQEADVAGIVSLDLLADSPSHRNFNTALWPPNAKSVLVYGLSHPPSNPGLDWGGFPGGTPGNQRLKKIGLHLGKSLSNKFELGSEPASYHPEKGGVYLKDAASLAGIGTIGENNLLIHPVYGPRLRFRALFLFAPFPQSSNELSSTAFNPCRGCRKHCQAVCPHHAFATRTYQVEPCSKQVGLENQTFTGSWIQYCRACELSCPVGIT